MQTPGERRLIDLLSAFLKGKQDSGVPHIMSIGAGTSLVVESDLQSQGLAFTCDRLDVEPCQVSAPYVGRSFQASIESMPMISDEAYDAVFANYVLEHVHDIASAAAEIKRILKPGGVFIVSTPNPQAPEFLISRFTPLWLHQLIRGDEGEEGHRAYETVYSYKNVGELVSIFAKAGLEATHVSYFPITEAYLERFPVINHISRAYDALVKGTRLVRLHGNACVEFKK